MSGLSMAELDSLEESIAYIACTHRGTADEWTASGCSACHEIAEHVQSAVEQIIAARVTAALNEAADDLHEAARAIVNADASSRIRKASLMQAVRTLRTRVPTDSAIAGAP